MNTINARYGNDPGIKAYTHVNDRFCAICFADHSSNGERSTLSLDGLTMNEAGRRIEEQHADT
jgi:TnpA family transposase